MITAKLNRHLLPVILCLTFSFAINAGALAAGAGDDVTVEDPWIRALPPEAAVTAAFMQLANQGAAAHRLVGAASPCAGAIELHEHQHHDGVMQMRRVPHIDLPPGHSVSLEPGGLHLMLFELRCPLATDTPIELELEFSDGTKQSLSIPVAKR